MCNSLEKGVRSENMALKIHEPSVKFACCPITSRVDVEKRVCLRNQLNIAGQEDYQESCCLQQQIPPTVYKRRYCHEFIFTDNCKSKIKFKVHAVWGRSVSSGNLLATFASSRTALGEILDCGVRKAEEIRPRWHNGCYGLGTKGGKCGIMLKNC